MGTVVRRGIFDGRDVAIKIVSREFWSEEDNEVSLLRYGDDHPNVVQYYWIKKSPESVYISLQLCEANLKEAVEQTYNPPGLDVCQILKDALEGLRHLHELERPIAHRDITPTNVLICVSSNHMRGLISDLGLGKKLNPHNQVFSVSMDDCSRGWSSPELIRIIRQPQQTEVHQATLKVDIFSFGILIFYVYTKGSHPFKDDNVVCDVDLRILNNEYSLRNLKDEFVVVSSLIKKMIHADATVRPSAKTVLNHPIFWSTEKISSYQMIVKNHLESQANNLQLSNKDRENIINWLFQIEKNGARSISATTSPLLRTYRAMQPFSKMWDLLCFYDDNFYPGKQAKKLFFLKHNIYIYILNVMIRAININDTNFVFTSSNKLMRRKYTLASGVMVVMLIPSMVHPTNVENAMITTYVLFAIQMASIMNTVC